MYGSGQRAPGVSFRFEQHPSTAMNTATASWAKHAPTSSIRQKTCTYCKLGTGQMQGLRTSKSGRIRIPWSSLWMRLSVAPGSDNMHTYVCHHCCAAYGLRNPSSHLSLGASDHPAVLRRGNAQQLTPKGNTRARHPFDEATSNAAELLAGTLTCRLSSKAVQSVWLWQRVSMGSAVGL